MEFVLSLVNNSGDEEVRVIHSSEDGIIKNQTTISVKDVNLKSGVLLTDFELGDSIIVA